MDHVAIPATERTPEVDFNYGGNIFALRGESYPEDVTAFFEPIVSQLDEHLGGLAGARVNFTFAMVYFNSSSAKVLMQIFDKLEETACNGNQVEIVWVYEEDDDNMKELGEDFGEDLVNAKFRLEAVSD